MSTEQTGPPRPERRALLCQGDLPLRGVSRLSAVNWQPAENSSPCTAAACSSPTVRFAVRMAAGAPAWGLRSSCGHQRCCACLLAHTAPDCARTRRPSSRVLCGAMKLTGSSVLRVVVCHLLSSSGRTSHSTARHRKRSAAARAAVSQLAAPFLL